MPGGLNCSIKVKSSSFRTLLFYSGVEGLNLNHIKCFLSFRVGRGRGGGLMKTYIFEAMKACLALRSYIFNIYLFMVTGEGLGWILRRGSG